jgi:hypothetical protein
MGTACHSYARAGPSSPGYDDLRLTNVLPTRSLLGRAAQRARIASRQRPRACRFSRFAARFSSKVFAGFFFVCFF